LKEREFNWYIAEKAPNSFSAKSLKAYNYDIFSARVGNIYTTSLLKQWTNWALGLKRLPDEYWVHNERFFDPFRPSIEPDGFKSLDELKASRNEALLAFKKCITNADVFVFTMGLTESWVNSEEDYEYPVCPGTIAGYFDSDIHIFRNQQFEYIRKNLVESMKLMRSVNPHLKFLLTVSPVPLTATNSGKNVIVATMESKSILRAVAGQVAHNQSFVDYFPSYEIINSPVFKGVFFEPNQRSVNPYGVRFVMNAFFEGLNIYSKADNQVNRNDVVCEEELLDAFGRDK
jgi:hypothetical protein